MSNEYFEDEYQYQEKKKVDAKEALTYMFKNGNASKFLGGAFIWALVSSLYFYVTMNINNAQNLDVAKIIGFLGLMIITTIVGVVVPGFIHLYQHDRALDKNAVMRDYSGNLLNSFLISVKTVAAWTIYPIAFVVLFIMK